MEMVFIPAGEFKMGSGESAEATAAFFNKTYGEDLVQADWFKDEHPQHRVRITKPFYLGTYHVTRGQFRQFVADTGYKTDAEKGEKPGAYGWDPDKKAFGFNEKYSWRNAGFEQTDEHPVINVSWNDAVEFCKWLSKKESKTYRLPTEAEWEYACRAGTTTRYYSGDDPETLAKVGNVADAAAKAQFPDWKFTIKANDGYVFTAPVGKFKPNAFGLYDMHGNAWQWCADWYGAEYYAKSPADDPTGPDTGDVRVLRGGSWGSGPDDARSAVRFWNWPSVPGQRHRLPRCQDSVILWYLDGDSLTFAGVLEHVPTLNDLADLLANAMQGPLSEEGRGRAEAIHLRNNPEWEELFPHLRQLKIEVVVTEALPKLDDVVADLIQYLQAKWSSREERQSAIKAELGYEDYMLDLKLTAIMFPCHRRARKRAGEAEGAEG